MEARQAGERIFDGCGVASRQHSTMGGCELLLCIGGRLLFIAVGANQADSAGSSGSAAGPLPWTSTAPGGSDMVAWPREPPAPSA